MLQGDSNVCLGLKIGGANKQNYSKNKTNNVELEKHQGALKLLERKVFDTFFLESKFYGVI